MKDRPLHIIASPYKTGTSSIAAALGVLGVARAPMPYRGDLLDGFQSNIKEANRLAHNAKAADRFDADHGVEVRTLLGRLLDHAQGFDVFHDAPLGHSHVHPLLLKTLFPAAHLIWVKRPKLDWLESVERWEVSHPRTYPNHASWRTDRAAMIARKMRRRRSARRAFSTAQKVYPRDTLVLEWSDLGRFDKLAQFYGVDVPDAPFPHANRAAETVKKC